GEQRMGTAVMRDRITESPRFWARIAGGMYLFVIVAGAFAELFVRGRLVVPGDAAATAHNIMAHQMLYRVGFTLEVFYCALNLPLALIFYKLFKVVNRNIALLGLFFDLVVNPIEAISTLGHFAPLILLGDAHYLRAFTPEQLQAASYISIQLFEHGFGICLLFFGFDLFTTAYLIVKSTFFPRIIGVLLAIEAAGYLINSFSLFLAPAVQARIFPYFAPTAIAEIALSLWLLIVGVNVPRWREQAAAAGVITN
ncbi:MAG: DUF4386 domain-containing protein, partial [Candidatus Sulfotelmatobacter sp.]